MDCVIKANKDAAPNNASTIKKNRILPRDFSVATGELTPTLKSVLQSSSTAVDAFTMPPRPRRVPYVMNDSKKSSKEEEWVDVRLSFVVVMTVVMYIL